MGVKFQRSHWGFRLFILAKALECNLQLPWGGGKAMTDEFKIFSNDSKSVSQNPTDWKANSGKNGTDTGFWDLINYFKSYFPDHTQLLSSRQRKLDVRQKEKEKLFYLLDEFAKCLGWMSLTRKEQGSGKSGGNNRSNVPHS